MKSKSYPKTVEQFALEYTSHLKSMILKLGVSYSDLDDVLSMVMIRILETDYIASYGKASLKSSEDTVDESKVANFDYYIWQLVHSVVVTNFIRSKFEQKMVNIEELHPVVFKDEKKVQSLETSMYFKDFYVTFRQYVVGYEERERLRFTQRYKSRYGREKTREPLRFEHNGVLYERTLVQVLDLMKEDKSMTEISKLLHVTVASISNWRAKIEALAEMFKKEFPEFSI